MGAAVNPVEKALWYIESHFASDISLDDVADVAGVSRFHLMRAFQAATGRSVMRHVRGRRLTQAARALADGAPDILAVALEAGYGSHEAFTRAFREQFGLPPEAVRAQRHLDNLELVEPIRMNETHLPTTQKPRIEQGRAMLIAGLGERFNTKGGEGITALWQQFTPHIGNVPGQIGQTCYGVCCNFDDDGNFDYIASVQVADISALPDAFKRIRIPEQRYAVFTHSDHVAAIRRTMHTIWSKWLPESGYEASGGPMFELYDARFDPHTGTGGLEIWIPVKA
jgi:AraC family transcriptional regulator